MTSAAAPGWFAGRFPSLAHHWLVWRESRRWYREAARHKRPRSDHEFLPAALEIQEKPPSPGLRWLMLSLCGLFAVAVLWACIGKIDVVATASGKVVPSGNTKIIQPIEIGEVRAIHVRNGQHVRRGQLLVELDPTLAGADEAAASEGMLTTQVVAARNAALLDHLAGRPARFVAPPGTAPEVAATQRAFVASAVAEYDSERAGLTRRRAEQSAALAGVEAEIAKLRQTLPLIDRQLDARKDLADRGYFQKLKLLEYEQLRVEHVQNIAVQEANALKTRAAMAAIDAELAQRRATFGKAAGAELADSQAKLGIARQEVAKSRRRSAFQQLRAPVDGTVQQLAISTVGGVVQPAQALMVIVPDEADVVVEANLLNRDIGFIREGQTARVKLEAFNFTDYGIIPGTVESISRDAIDTSRDREPQFNDKGRPQQQGLVYAARIRLGRRTIAVAGRDQVIGPGLAAQVEIKTGERRIIQYLLSPIAQSLDEAGRER